MRSSNAGRWSLAALVVVIALIVAIWPRDRGNDVEQGGPSSSAAADDPSALARAREQAGLQPCPAATGAAPSGPLAGIRLDCLGDGSPVQLGSALAGKPTLLNLWAYWCAPCATELPYLRDYAARAGTAINLLTVHSDPSAVSGLARLADLGVRLPAVQDGSKQVAAAVSAPPVLPVSVLLRADGSIAEVVARPFTGVDDIAATVRRSLGVAA